jgi:SpoVK/Ycf46/Vps4 family AAA+-type ATPase
MPNNSKIQLCPAQQSVLEMKLPGVEARTVILTQRVAELPEELRQVDLAALRSATEGFTGADLKRLVEDGKAIYAYDKAKRLDLKAPTDYFLKAVEGVRENKQRFAEAEAQAALKPKLPMAGFTSYMMRSFSGREGGEE